MDYKIDYNDERFTNVTNEKNAAITNLNNTYNDMIGQTDEKYQGMIDTINTNADKQAELVKQQGQLAIDKIENEKTNAQNDYIKQQKGAYADWQRESAGQNVAMAAQGLNHSGYSESSQLGLYNTYQNRVGLAKESLDRTMADYNLAAKDAMLQNSSALLQIYADAAKEAAALSLEAFQYKNGLITELTNKQMQYDTEYYNRWKDVQNQINSENQFKENIRQYNEQMAYKKEQDRIAQEQWQKEFNLARSKTYSSSSSKSSGGLNPYSAGGISANGVEIKANPYTGEVNKDAKNGVFSNGYQPNNVDGKALSSSGMKVSYIFSGAKGSTGIDMSGQTIWEAGGNYYIWDGSINDYIKVTNEVKSVLNMKQKTGDKNTTHKWVI